MGIATRRAAQGLTALALVAGAVLGGSAPAQATAHDCMSYLAGKGYLVGPGAHAACVDGEQWDGHPRCVHHLVGLGVAPNHAESVCRRASLPDEPR